MSIVRFYWFGSSVGDLLFYLWLERFEQGTSEARETCRGHVSMPVCVPALQKNAVLFCHFLHSVL